MKQDFSLSPSGVARICWEEGQRWKLCHGALMVDFRAGCSSCLMTDSFVTNAVLIERAVRTHIKSYLKPFEDTLVCVRLQCIVTVAFLHCVQIFLLTYLFTYHISKLET